MNFKYVARDTTPLLDLSSNTLGAFGENLISTFQLVLPNFGAFHAAAINGSSPDLGIGIDVSGGNGAKVSICGALLEPKPAQSGCGNWFQS